MKSWLLASFLVVFAVSASADVIYLRGTGEKKAIAVRGSIKPAGPGTFLITRENGDTEIVHQRRVISILKDNATLPAKEVLKAKASKDAAKAKEPKEEDKASGLKIEGSDPAVKKSENKPREAVKAAPKVEKPAVVTKVLAYAKGAKWTKSDGAKTFTDEVTSEDGDAASMTFSLKRSFKDPGKRTKYWKVLRIVENGKTTWKIKRGLAAATTVFIEPSKIGTTWKDGSGDTWRVTSLTEAYTDRAGKTYQNCVRVDQIDGKGVVQEGRQQVYAAGIGRINDGLISYSLKKN